MRTKKMKLNEFKTLLNKLIKEEVEKNVSEKYLKMDDILSGIKSLARSQGSYGRLYSSLMDIKENDSDRYDDIVNELESQKFKDIVDFVMYFES
jgi:hypothetical protein